MAKKSTAKTTVKADRKSLKQQAPAFRLHLLVASQSATRIREVMPGTTLVVGREEGADVRLDDPMVSRKHATIEIGKKAITIVDHGSTNGVLVDGERIEDKTGAAPGQEIRIGSAVLLFIKTNELSSYKRNKFAYSELTPAADKGDEQQEPFIIEDPVMKSILKAAEKAASADVSVFILGETGVGKEMIARHIHRSSDRRSANMVKIFCPAFPESLIESELFGYERGAFTGASARKQGLLESADRGILFLDEIMEIPVSFQTKLLRFLDDRKIVRLGGNREIYVDTRVITAANRDPEDAIRTGRFRDDLYFRLSTVQLYIPPLRNRKSDIIPMAEGFAGAMAASANKAAPLLDHGFMDILMNYDWPGNVRELKSVVESAVILSDSSVLKADHLPALIRKNEEDSRKALSEFKGMKQKAEREAIVKALEACGWNQTRAALLLGISRRNLVYKIKKFGLKKTYG